MRYRLAIVIGIALLLFLFPPKVNAENTDMGYILYEY